MKPKGALRENKNKILNSKTLFLKTREKINNIWIRFILISIYHSISSTDFSQKNARWIRRSRLDFGLSPADKQKYNCLRNPKKG